MPLGQCPHQEGPAVTHGSLSCSAVSIGPTIAIVAAPVAGALRRVAIVAANIALAAQPLWELAMYAACLYIIGEWDFDTLS